MFVTFEGLDGSGTTTQTELLREHLAEMGRDVVATRERRPRGFVNRAIEREVADAGGRKSLYSDAYYSEDEFWSLHDRDAYDLIRGALEGEGSFGGHGSVAGGSVELPDTEARTLKRLERRLEKNILRTMGVDGVTVRTLGG